MATTTQNTDSDRGSWDFFHRNVPTESHRNEQRYYYGGIVCPACIEEDEAATEYDLHYRRYAYAGDCPRYSYGQPVADKSAFLDEAGKREDGRACPICAGFLRADMESE